MHTNEFRRELSIGIPELDEQHAQLFECLWRLASGADDRQEKLGDPQLLERFRPEPQADVRGAELQTKIASIGRELERRLQRVRSLQQVRRVVGPRLEQVRRYVDRLEIGCQ